ncbi:MAG TPA: hypothetical protein VFD41_10585 [Actinomycetales bacterium]|nr:hypothetical protein [Actinomycetales bacterium]
MNEPAADGCQDGGRLHRAVRDADDLGDGPQLRRVHAEHAVAQRRGDRRSLGVQERELTVTGTFRYAHTWPEAIELVAAGRVDLDALVTGHYALAEVEEALTAASGDPRVIKPVVRPQE